MPSDSHRDLEGTHLVVKLVYRPLCLHIPAVKHNFITRFELRRLQMVFIIPWGHLQSRFPQVLVHGTSDTLPLRDSNAARWVIQFR